MNVTDLSHVREVRRLYAAADEKVKATLRHHAKHAETEEQRRAAAGLLADIEAMERAR